MGEVKLAKLHPHVGNYVILVVCRNHHVHLGLEGGGNLLRRYLMLALLVALIMVTMILLMTRVGRGVASKDPALDWRHNPNLRTRD